MEYKHYTSVLIGLITVLVIWVIFSVVMITKSVNQSLDCDKACGPDKHLSSGCYDDRVICVGKDHLYVKEMK